LERWKKFQEDFKKGVTNVKGTFTSLYDESLGLKALKVGDYNNALDHYFRALESTEKTGDIDKKTILLITIGYIFFNLGNNDEAVKYFQQALQICEEAGDLENKSLCLNHIGEVCRLWGKYDDALKYYQKVLQICEETGNINAKGLAIGNCGEVYNLWGKCDEAYEYYRQALQIFKETGHMQNISKILSSIGNLERKRNKFSKALENHLEALKIAKKQKANHFIAKFLSEVGKDHMALGQNDQAINFFKDSIAKYHNVLEKVPVDQRREFESEFECLYDELDKLLDQSKGNMDLEKQEEINFYKKEILDTLLEAKKEREELQWGVEKNYITEILDMFIEKPKDLEMYLRRVIRSDWSEVKKDNWAKVVREIIQDWKQLQPKKWERLVKGVLKRLVGKIGLDDALSELITIGMQNLFDWIKSSK